MTLNPVDMIFSYEQAYDGHEPEAYETLLLDVMAGNPTLFMRADQVEAAWGLVEPVLQGWQSTNPRHFPNYAAGSEGPIAANDLLAKDGRSWRAIRILGGK